LLRSTNEANAAQVDPSRALMAYVGSVMEPSLPRWMPGPCPYGRLGGEGTHEVPCTRLSGRAAMTWFAQRLVPPSA
jgi:hypothetical protein